MGTHQVGYVEGQTSSYSGRYAALWSGTSDSIVILPPFDIGAYSEALSIAGNEIVGYNDYSFNGGAGDGGGGTAYIIHAALWNVSSANLIDLHPNLPGANSPGDQRSKAYDTDGAYQVGWTNFYVPQSDGNFSSETRAMLWHGTSESAVILHPPNWDVSYAYGVKNGTQVGYGIQNVDMGGVMALVWHGSAETLTILGEGTALDTNGATHVGSISVGYSSHAFRWDGDTGTGVDLHNLLPAGYINSGATDIDDAGNIIGVHAAHDLDAGDQGGLIAFELRGHRRLVQDAVNAVADAQLILRRLEMDVGRAVLVGFPDHLVDEFDDAGFLVALGDFLVFADEQFQRLVFGQFIQSFCAHAVILLERLLDFDLGRQGKLDRAARVEPHRVEHGCVEGIADSHLDCAVAHRCGQDRVLEGDLGGDAAARLGGDVQLGQVQIRPVQGLGQLLEKNLLPQAALTADETQQRLGRAVGGRHTPGLVPLLQT